MNTGINQPQSAAQFSTAAAGTALTFTIPANIQASALSATAANFVGGAPTVALQIVRGANTIELARGTSAINFNSTVPLLAGDVIRWQVITGVAATTVDFTIGVQFDPHSFRITVSTLGPAVLDQGQNIFPGFPPQYIDADIMGGALAEQIFAIAANGSPVISVIDVFT